MFDLSARRALVTGAGQGVGVGIVRALAGQGAAVAVNDVVASRADDTVQSLAGLSSRLFAAPFDVTDLEAARAGIAAAENQLGGPIDILVNNAGIPAVMAPTQFRDMDPEQWAHYVDLNLYGSLHCIGAVLDGMCERGFGRIVQISSGAGRHGIPIGVSLYGASKSAIEGFLRHIAAEVASNGVTANAIALGLMHSDGMDRTVTDGLARSIPVGRLGLPDDVGPAVVYVASDEAAWLTGQTIDLNGGSTMH
jgi:3-oxoacyl-[acyl-carrier protein] reductase